MQLHSRKYGSGPPVIILHGLLGMSDNWISAAKSIAERGFCVHLPDLRNHGNSPHADTHRYPDMCEDLIYYLNNEQLESSRIIGHSMGGKLAMIMSLLHPERVEKLVVVDIAPSDYRKPENTFHARLISTLLQMDLSAYTRRSEIRKALEVQTGDNDLAMFLTKNITRDNQKNSFKWKCNLPVLYKFIQHLHTGLEDLDLYAPCSVQTLFVKGNDSTYYTEEHESDRQHFFPDSRVIGIDNAGHWLHSQQPAKFLNILANFL